MSDKWQALKDHHAKVAARPILELFAQKDRAHHFSARAGAMLFDYSKTNIDETAKALLLELAMVSGVAEKRAAMFGGEKINDTEGRAVLHTALRAPETVSVIVDGRNVVPAVHDTLARQNGNVVPGRTGNAGSCGKSVCLEESEKWRPIPRSPSSVPARRCS